MFCRTFWVVVMLTSLGGFVYTASDSLFVFLSNPNINHYYSNTPPPSRPLLPSLTICNLNPLRLVQMAAHSRFYYLIFITACFSDVNFIIHHSWFDRKQSCSIILSSCQGNALTKSSSINHKCQTTFTFNISHLRCWYSSTFTYVDD